MLEKELRDKRIKSGLTLIELGKLLNCNPAYISNMENGVDPITKKIEKRLNNVINDEYSLGITNKSFSREKFLLNMLTGNSLVDEIYLEANWLKNMDNKPAYTMGQQRNINLENHKIDRVISKQKQYIILDTSLFYCKEEWLK